MKALGSCRVFQCQNCQQIVHFSDTGDTIIRAEANKPSRESGNYNIILNKFLSISSNVRSRLRLLATCKRNFQACLKVKIKPLIASCIFVMYVVAFLHFVFKVLLLIRILCTYYKFILYLYSILLKMTVERSRISRRRANSSSPTGWC